MNAVYSLSFAFPYFTFFKHSSLLLFFTLEQDKREFYLLIFVICENEKYGIP